MDKRPLLAILVTFGTAAALLAVQRREGSPAAGSGTSDATPAAITEVAPMNPSPTSPRAESPAPTGARDPDVDRGLPPVASAIEAFAASQNVEPGQVRVLSLRSVTWNDGSLGCPQPGQMYTQALVDGYRLELAAADRQAIYHTDARRRAVRCDAERPGSWDAGGATE